MSYEQDALEGHHHCLRCCAAILLQITQIKNDGGGKGERCVWMVFVWMVFVWGCEWAELLASLLKQQVAVLCVTQ